MKDGLLPNIASAAFAVPDAGRLETPAALAHKPRILLLYGSVRKRSYSRFLAFEAQRLLEAFGCETQLFHADGLPLPDGADDGHAKVQELRELATWSEGQVWCSPERHGAMSGIMKAQIDWIPLSLAFQEFDDDGRMKPSAYYDRVVDVTEELTKFTLLLRGRAGYLVDRYSERKESAVELSARVNQRSI
jgi:arsenic resistance protein ArsH